MIKLYDTFSFYGLSLCIQGTRLAKCPTIMEWRFIPVYTGNTVNNSDPHIFNSVYPCVYREHILTVGRGCVDSGLSLCIQGTHPVFVSAGDKCRFIPVYTGNTRINCFFSCWTLGLSLCIQGTRCALRNA